jgi:hypothetical protein
MSHLLRALTYMPHKRLRSLRARCSEFKGGNQDGEDVVRYLKTQIAALARLICANN